MFAQEICDNGIDDDFDGQIDINDDDCLCLSPGVNVVENSSFESYTICPTMSSQGVTATDWINGGLGTADYFNLCANCCTPFTFPGPPMPLPIGAGVMGFANSASLKDGQTQFFQGDVSILK